MRISEDNKRFTGLQFDLGNHVIYKISFCISAGTFYCLMQAVKCTMIRNGLTVVEYTDDLYVP